MQYKAMAVNDILKVYLWLAVFQIRFKNAYTNGS